MVLRKHDSKTLFDLILLRNTRNVTVIIVFLYLTSSVFGNKKETSPISDYQSELSKVLYIFYLLVHAILLKTETRICNQVLHR
jgi:hypothetical protein